MKEVYKFITAMFVFALVAGLSAPAKAADTSDVIAGVIFGGIIGSQIERNRFDPEPFVTYYPHGTIIVPGYRQHRNMVCYFEMDQYGYTVMAVPTCQGRNRSSYNNRYVNRQIQQHDLWPCGHYWGIGCKDLARKLKSGEIQGVFDFTHR